MALRLESRSPISIRIGTISVDLVANTVSFSKELSKMSQLSLNTSRNIQRSLTLISGAATAMAASIVGSLTAAIDKAEDFAFSMQKMAQQTGSSVEMFSKLAYSAKLAGVPVDDVKMAMEKLARTSSAAQNGNKEAVAAYAALGISVKDLQGPLKDSGNLMVAASKSLDKFKDSTAKTGLEQKIFGRSGAELAPLLSQIASGFDTASQQATLFGVVVGDKTASQAKQLHESLEQLESVALGFSTRLLSGVSPALQDASDKILKFVTSANGMKAVDTIANDVSKAVYSVGNAFEFLQEHSTAVKRTFEGLAVLQVASIFLPMITSSAAAGKGVDSIGLVAIKMASRVTGLTSLGTAFTPLIKGALTGETSLLKMYRAFGFMDTGAYAAKTALGALNTAMLLNPITAALAVLAAVGTAFHHISEEAMASEVDGGKWADVWNASLLAVKDSMNDVIKTIDLLTGNMADFFSRDWKFKSFNSLVQQAGQARRGMTDDQYRMMQGFNGADKILQSAKQSPAMPKLNAPLVPTEQNDKIDHLKLKMDELAAAAKAAQDTLRNAGKSVDFERADEISKEYTKTIIELEAALKTQHKTLSDADKAALEVSISTRVNDLSQAKYRDELQKATDGILAQVQAQDILTRAIGKGADAVRAAAIAANAAKRDTGKSDEWKQQNAVRRSVDDVAFGMNYDRTNAGTAQTSLKSVQDQINAQLILNGAITQGTHARQEAALAVEQEAIRSKYSQRGDTDQSALNAELIANQRLFDLKQQEANLTRAMSMDPTNGYREQARALEDAASAAKEAGIAISYMQTAAANKANWNSYLESVDKTTLAVGNASQGVTLFFNQMARDSESAAEQVHTVLEGAFNSLNSTLERLIERQKTSFAEFFRGISQSLVKLGLQKGEQAIAGSIMSALGKGENKPTTTLAAVNRSNTYLEQMTGFLRQMASKGPMGSDGGSVGGSTDSSWNTGIGSTASALTPFASLIPGVGPLLSGFMGGFGGHRALGGDVTAGMTYDVGEMGRERFTPTQNGKITPTKDMGKKSGDIHIDARGSNDPAQTEAAVHRAMAGYAPHMARGTATAMAESKSRRPSMSR